MRAPAFWWQEPGLAAALLSPVAAIYGLIAAARLNGEGHRARVPVICVGDPTIGGGGKTPTAIAIAKLLIAAGERPCFITRGYGGSAGGPLFVDATVHGADVVGDEALLLARTAPTVVARDRIAGAEFATERDPTVLVLDDGFQNPSLVKDFSLLVIDAATGIGNGYVFPAGPLRAPLAAQFARAQAVVLSGRGAAGDAIARIAATASSRGVPFLTAKVVAEPAAAAKIAGQRLLAYCGVGRPEKFFRTLAAVGGNVVERRAFDDHHAYARAEADALLAAARAQGLTLVTTEKDKARMAGAPELASLAAASLVLPMTVELEDARGLMQRVGAALRR
jgi:tetraacyldisaccharide 4'-kinase